MTLNDGSILAKLFDPESNPTDQVLVDSLLPEDPHVPDPKEYQRIQDAERKIILSVERALRTDDSRQPTTPSATYDRLTDLHGKLSGLIEAHPASASLLNNRAQLSRLCLSNERLLPSGQSQQDQRNDPPSIKSIIQDLNQAITLMTPPTPQSPISPYQGKVLAQAHTQRASLLHAASKTPTLRSELASSFQNVESSWDATDFAEAASRDFFVGGRYGNEVAKNLAVYTNPTAKLCNQMVQEAMRREIQMGTKPVVVVERSC
ncbi:hypothetical protein MMC25_002737 [Agyrium rufum]|nr:hypothetical protein [Agyrium rufum]